jgi:hypothetical protein
VRQAMCSGNNKILHYEASAFPDADDRAGRFREIPMVAHSPFLCAFAVMASRAPQGARLPSGRGTPGALGFWDGSKASLRLLCARFRGTVSPDSGAAVDAAVGAAI